ncbi:MAG TPA: acyltransferase [Rhizomicrobium sp.]
MNETRPVAIRALLGARALPPLILVLFHYCEGHGYRGAAWFDLPVAKGYLWVEFFFALSGFVLTYAYASRAAEFWRAKAYFAFLKARLARLYPSHIFMLLVILAMVIALRFLAARGGYVSIYDEPWHPIDTWPTFVANLFLVQAWNIFPYLSWNGASWFVSVEFLLCLLFPFYVLFARGGWTTALLLIFAGAGALALLVHPRYGLDLTFHNGIWRGMAAFAVGVGMAILHNTIRKHDIRISDTACSAMQLAVLAWLFYGIYCTGWSHRPQDIYTALPIMALVFVLCFDRGFLATALKTRLPVALGEWSYAIYIGQTAVLQFLRFAQMRLYPAPADIVLGRPWSAWQPFWHWLEPTLLVVAAVAWGWLVFTLIERPANAALRRLFAGAPARAATSA